MRSCTRYVAYARLGRSYLDALEMAIAPAKESLG